MRSTCMERMRSTCLTACAALSSVVSTSSKRPFVSGIAAAREGRGLAQGARVGRGVGRNVGSWVGDDDGRGVVVGAGVPPHVEKPC